MRATSIRRATGLNSRPQLPGADTMTLNIAVTVRILICQWFNGGSTAVHRHCNGFMVPILCACWKMLEDVGSISSAKKRRPHTTTSRRRISILSCLLGGMNDPKAVSFRFVSCTPLLEPFLWSKYTRALVRKQMWNFVKLSALKVYEMMTSSNRQKGFASSVDVAAENARLQRCCALVGQVFKSPVGWWLGILRIFTTQYCMYSRGWYQPNRGIPTNQCFMECQRVLNAARFYW